MNIIIIALLFVLGAIVLITIEQENFIYILCSIVFLGVFWIENIYINKKNSP